jgi:P4 family phage/plasmid primase-like protien
VFDSFEAILGEFLSLNGGRWEGTLESLSATLAPFLGEVSAHRMATMVRECQSVAFEKKWSRAGRVWSICNTSCNTSPGDLDGCNTSCNTSPGDLDGCNTSCNTSPGDLDGCNTSCNTSPGDLDGCNTSCNTSPGDLDGCNTSCNTSPGDLDGCNTSCNTSPGDLDGCNTSCNTSPGDLDGCNTSCNTSPGDLDGCNTSCNTSDSSFSSSEVLQEELEGGEESADCNTSEQSKTFASLVSTYYEQKGQNCDYKSEAARFLMAIRKQGEIVEIRCLPSGKGAIYAGLFGDMSLAAAKAVALNGKFKGTYFTLNPASGVATDKVSASADTIRDSQILHRSWLLIDIEGDRENAKACNASDQELERALILAEKVRKGIATRWGATPLALCSGNGAHLLYQIDLPNTPEATELVRGALKGLAAKLARFDGATIDTTVSNPSRISKLPGTLTRKGTHTDDRPQRIARVLDWSVSGQLPKEALDEWFAAAPKPTATAPAPKSAAAGEWESGVDPKERARKWLEKRGPAISGQRGDEFTLTTASWMVREFALIDDDALELLLDWNQRNSPPWSEAELRVKIAHGRKYGKGAYGSALAVKPARKELPDDRLNKFEHSDLGNAEAVLACYGHRLVYNRTQDAWLIWSGKHWAADTGNKLYAWVNKTTRQRKEAAWALEDENKRKAAVAHARKSEGYRSRQSCIEQMKAFTPYVKNADDFDRDLMSLSVANGTLDLRAGTLSPHKAEDLITKTVSVDYDPAAECPRWLEFLNTAMLGDADLVAYLQRCAGYTLTGATKEHAVFICHGGGRNGKSLFLDILSELLGDYATPTSSSTFTEKETESISNAIAVLNGARLVKCNETNQSFKLDEAIIKSLSGEDVVTARFLYQEYFKFKPRFKVWLATNYKPIISGTDCGIWRRIKLIPWLHEVPIELVDYDLGNKLREELPGILAWAVRGCLEWQQNGLREPKAVIKAIAEYQNESDNVGRFIIECCEVETFILDNPEEALSVLYSGYCAWAKDQGLRGVLSKVTFARKLREKGFKSIEKGRFKHAWVQRIKLMAVPALKDRPKDEPSDDAPSKALREIQDSDDIPDFFL